MNKKMEKYGMVMIKTNWKKANADDEKIIIHQLHHLDLYKNNMI